MSSGNREGKSFSDNMPLEDSSMLFLSSAAVVSLIAIIVICVCGCRKSVPKNELLGLAGKVKLTNPESALEEGHPHEGGHTPNGAVADEVDSIGSLDTKYRNVVDTSTNSTCGVATATRSLPDLPIDPTRRTSNSADVWDKNGEQNSGGDTGSDLYATVEEHKMAANGRLNKKVSQSTNAVLEQGQSGSYASPTTDDSVSPYACFRKDHPYDKVKQAEHPYAQVSSVKKKKKLTRDLQSSLESSTSTASSRSEEPKSSSQQPGGAPASPLAPIVRTRRPSWEGGDSSSQSSARDSIPAAGAISGAVAASNELPYMTPPIVNETQNTGGPGGPHFSGDSQDSGKGYTCISVREPLSNISRPRRMVESSHYATVSDDSDETYEAIEEPVPVYTSGSETYAKIAPIARPEPSSPPQLPSLRSANSTHQSATSNNTSSSSQHQIQRAHSPLIHAAADVNLSTSPKLHVNTSLHIHSRQSSNSSQISTDHSTEKQRRTNSPLPKTPELIDDMYAKVMKMSRKTKQGSGTRQRTESNNWSSSSYEEERPSVDNVKPSTSDPYESLTHSSVGYERINKQRNSILDEDDMDPNYEKILRKTSNNEEDIGYAQINQHTTARHQRSNSEAQYDNGYEQIHKTSANTNDDPEANYDMGYERIHHRTKSRQTSHAEDNYDVGYEQIHKTNASDHESNYDVRYEKIHRKDVHASEAVPDDDDNDPNYEELKTGAREHIANDEFDDPNYEVLSTVRKRTEPAATNQNNSELTEHNYASINKYNKKKYRQSEPNFPSAINNNESTYECMNDCYSEDSKESASHKRSNSVSRIEVEPNVFYSQVQKMKR
uniref:Uncharacterized protein n=2 Tax=Cacopsylla melanoneura TaxID=428564 RepID=A0A8D8Y7E0_9HEMI